jgi:predicted cupin superfamily sugar epimerase
VENGQQPQVLVPAGHWQSARPVGNGSVLVSCVVSPGFEFADFRVV